MNKSLVHCLSVKGRRSVHAAAVLSPRGEKRRWKVIEKRGLFPAHSLSCCCSSLSAHISDFRTHTPESHTVTDETHTHALFTPHTQTFSCPQEWFMITPLISPGEQWVRMRGAGIKNIQYNTGKGMEERGVTMSSLAFGALEEAADALCSRNISWTWASWCTVPVWVTGATVVRGRKRRTFSLVSAGFILSARNSYQDFFKSQCHLTVNVSCWNGDDDCNFVAKAVRFTGKKGGVHTVLFNAAPPKLLPFICNKLLYDCF